jgi:5-formyltetrahydrofolate cyclo-ligase
VPESTAEQKDQVRKQCRQIRLALVQPFREQASRTICNHIANWPIFQDAKVILTYMPVKAEVDLRSLLEDYPKKNWVLPRIVSETEHNMCFHPYNPRQLVRHRFGMDEPAASLPVVSPAEIQLTLVPGLAYDRCGWRLGYGGGYYDRFLAIFSGASLGVTFNVLLLDSLPHVDFDVPMKWLVTEKGLAGIWKSCSG